MALEAAFKKLGTNDMVHKNAASNGNIVETLLVLAIAIFHRGVVAMFWNEESVALEGDAAHRAMIEHKTFVHALEVRRAYGICHRFSDVAFAYWCALGPSGSVEISFRGGSYLPSELSQGTLQVGV